MLEKILGAVVTGLFFPILVEIWKERRNRRADFRSFPSPVRKSSASRETTGSVGLRLLASGVLGFIGAALNAAFIEKPDRPINYGSPMATFLIVVWILGIYILLSIRAARRSD